MSSLQRYLTLTQMGRLNRYIIETIEGRLRTPVPSEERPWEFVFEFVQDAVNDFIRQNLTNELYAATRTDMGRREMAIVFYNREDGW